MHHGKAQDLSWIKTHRCALVYRHMQGMSTLLVCSKLPIIFHAKLHFYLINRFLLTVQKVAKMPYACKFGAKDNHGISRCLEDFTSGTYSKRRDLSHSNHCVHLTCRPMPIQNMASSFNVTFTQPTVTEVQQTSFMLHFQSIIICHIENIVYIPPEDIHQLITLLQCFGVTSTRPTTTDIHCYIFKVL